VKNGGGHIEHCNRS